jgi:hypothetical protein
MSLYETSRGMIIIGKSSWRTGCREFDRELKQEERLDARNAEKDATVQAHGFLTGANRGSRGLDDFRIAICDWKVPRAETPRG